MNNAAFIFPAVKGIQAKREYYISMVPLDAIPRIFQFIDEDLPAEARSQRILNKARVPEIRDYMLDNLNDYVFSSLTVSVDGDMEFTSISSDDPSIGHIKIDMSARFLINDGQHRSAAIAEAIKKNIELRREQISVVFYHDEGLQRSQQMFSDLNRYAIRPTRSINILFNSREEASIIAKHVVDKVDIFCGLTEKENTSISNRSKALFTLSAICTATSELLKGSTLDTESKINLACTFWDQVALHMAEWRAVKSGELRASDVRKHYICSLSITLVALGAGGKSLISAYPNSWIQHLDALDSIDWHKTNMIWEDLVFVGGKIAANRATQRAMSNYIIRLLTENAGDECG